MLDFDAHTEREHEPGEVHELPVAAEGVDVELPVEPAARERERRLERLDAIVLGDADGRQSRRRHATSSAGRS